MHIDNGNPLYTQKALCLVSHYAFLNEFKEALKQIYRLHLSKNDIPIEVSLSMKYHNPEKESNMQFG